MRTAFVFLSLAVAVWAQRPSFGLKVGVPISAVCASQSSDRFGSANVCADRYLIGPAIEVEIAGSLSLDAAALFASTQMQGSARPASIFPSFSTQRTGTTWEIPIMARYRVSQRRAAPFVGGGPTFRRITFSGQNTIINVSGPPTPGQVVTSVSEVDETHWQAGVAVGGGIAFRTGFVRFSPELRYSHWGSADPCSDCGPLALPVARSNWAVLLLGITF